MSNNYLIQGMAVDQLWKLMHHEYHCEDCQLCEKCHAMSDDPLLTHDASLFLCEDCQLCEKSTSAEAIASLGEVQVLR